MKKTIREDCNLMSETKRRPVMPAETNIHQAQQMSFNDELIINFRGYPANPTLDDSLISPINHSLLGGFFSKPEVSMMFDQTPPEGTKLMDQKLRGADLFGFR